MTFEEYQINAIKTAIFPSIHDQFGRDISYTYSLVGLMNEFFEFLLETSESEPNEINIQNEIGDVLWYFSILLYKLDLKVKFLNTTDDCCTPSLEQFKNPRLEECLKSSYVVFGRKNTLAYYKYEHIISDITIISSICKKNIRGDFDFLKDEIKTKMLADACYNFLCYLGTFAKIFGSDLNKIAERNLEKLRKRHEKNKLMGDGGNR